MIPIVKQDGYLCDVNGFSSEVVEILAQQFNQTLIVGHTSLGAVGKKWQPQCIDGEMSFDAIGVLVMTEPFRLGTGIARIFHRLRVDD